MGREYTHAIPPKVPRLFTEHRLCQSPVRELSINAGTRCYLTRTALLCADAPCSNTVPPGPSSICVPYRFPAYPALCNGHPDLLIRSSEFMLFSKIYPKITRSVKSCWQSSHPAADLSAAARGPALPDGRDGIWQSAWQRAMNPSPARAPQSPPVHKPNKSGRTGRSQASAGI